MLILTRRVGETFLIGDTITITVLSIKGNQIRIGINAPKTISIYREEIYQKIKYIHTNNIYHRKSKLNYQIL